MKRDDSVSAVCIPDDIAVYIEEADEIWEKHQNSPAFDSYASADYSQVYSFLARLRDRANTFLELGSGLGVVTIMASRLGYEAYGIEASDELLEFARCGAEQLAPNATFGSGSFIPNTYVWNLGSGDESEKTIIDLPDAYGEIDMDLSEFQLIYAYPWPTEHALYHNILKQFAQPGTLFLAYDAREGMLLNTI